MSSIISALTNFIVHVISAAGYTGVATLMAIESAAIPLPSEIIMPFAGFLAGEGRFNLWLLALAGGAGSAIGSTITYWLGRYGGRPLIERYGKYVLISQQDLDIADRFFARFGPQSAFIGRLLPVVRTFISVPAGIARVKFVPFIFYSFLGSVIWSWVLAYIGLRLGGEWVQLHERAKSLDYLIIILIVVGLVWWVRRHLKHRRSWCLTKQSESAKIYGLLNLVIHVNDSFTTSWQAQPTGIPDCFGRKRKLSHEKDHRNLR